jgi:hypothetical protein
MLIWLGLLLVWIVPFQLYGLPAEQLRNIIYREAFFIWVYVALAVVTVSCVTARAGDAWKRALRAPAVGTKLRPVGQPVGIAGAWDSARAMRALQAAGLGRRVEGDGWVWGVRHRWSSLGTVASHLAIVLVILLGAWWVSRPEPFQGSVLVAEGERFDGALSSYVETMGAEPPAVAFDLVSVDPRFHEDVLLFTRLDCQLVSNTGRTHSVRLGKPWYPEPTTQVAIEDFGWTAEVLGGRESTTVVGPSVYKLQVFPPGSPDYIDVAIEDARYRLKVVVYGDYIDRDGVPGVRSFNLTEPRIGLSAWRILANELPVEIFKDRVIAPGEQVSLAGEDSVVVLDVATYGKFRISRVFPVPAALVVGLLMLAGFSARLVVPRVEAVLAPGEGGSVELRVRSEIYGPARYAERVARAWEEAGLG